MANPVVGELNEGKDWRNAHAAAAATFYWGLLRAKCWADGTITDVSTYAGLAAEEAATGYARKPVVMGASVNGIMALPGATFTNLANAWHNDICSAFISPNTSGPPILDVWDIGGRFGSITSGSAVVTGLSSLTTDLRPGMVVKGVGIPAGAMILTVDSATQITLTANATATSIAALAFVTDMSALNSELVIPALSDFLKNPWE